MEKHELGREGGKRRTWSYDVKEDLEWRSIKWANSLMVALQLSTTKLTNAICSSATYYSSKYKTKHLRHRKEFFGIPDAVDLG